MRRRFLHRPEGAVELAADALRILGLLGVAVALVGWGPTDAGVLSFVLLGLVIPRFLGMRGPLDLLAGAMLLVAGWSSVLGLYAAISWWDLAVHFAANGAIAAMAYLLLVRVGVVAPPEHSPRSVVVFLCAIAGFAAGAVWEVLEWAGHTFIDEAIFVDYTDTIGDMALGGAGSVAVGLLMTRMRWTLRPDPESRSSRVGSVPASRAVDHA